MIPGEKKHVDMSELNFCKHLHPKIEFKTNLMKHQKRIFLHKNENTHSTADLQKTKL